MKIKSEEMKRKFEEIKEYYGPSGPSEKQYNAIMNDEVFELEETNDREIINLLKTRSDEIGDQKSEKWLKWREGLMTGSDISKLFINHRTPIEHAQADLINSKLGLGHSFEGNEYTRHGNFYESTACEKYSSKYTYEVTSFNGLEHKTCKYLGMSPDGVVFKMDENDNIESIILVEIKCPFKRVIDGKISKPYRYQCQLGMEILTSWFPDIPIMTSDFVEFKPENFGYCDEEILLITSILYDYLIGEQMVIKSTEFFERIEPLKHLDHDRILE
ncbi:MAG: YqaJ viral recombinase family protein [Clostridium sp.]